MTNSKEIKDDVEILALADEARQGSILKEQRHTKNDIRKATLEIKTLLKQLRRLIFDMVNDITMMIVIEHDNFALTRSQRLTKENSVLVLNKKELSDVTARELIFNFHNTNALFLKVESTTYLYDECSTHLGYNATKDMIIESKLKAENSGETDKFIDATTKKWSQIIPAVTIDVLYIKEKDS